MPHLTVQFGAAGPLLDVLISVSAPRQAALQQAAQAVPGPQIARALIDTGASMTAVDPAITTALALAPTGQTTIHTPSTAAGQPHSCNTYDIHLTLSHPALSFSITALPVIQSNLHHQGIQALIGRDVLANCLLVYDGRAGSYVLAF
jgi:hypothetical protein